jgi:hypothetical protein
MVKFEIEPILKLKICFLNLVFRITYQVPYRGSNPENFSPLSKRVAKIIITQQIAKM